MAQKKATIFTTNAAQRKQFAPLRTAGINAGTSSFALITAYRAALGKRPSLTLYRAGTLELKAALMASALINGGDNREHSVLVDHCRERLTHYQGFGGKAKLRDGMKGRRTKQEEAAYLSARVQMSGLNAKAGVANPEPRGGDTSKTRNGVKKGQGKAQAKPAANVNTKPATPKCKTAEQMVAYALTQAKALQTVLNRSAAVCPAALGEAINAFVSAAIEADKAL